MTRNLFYLLTIVCFCYTSKTGAQSCPPNLDFESGTFSNWQCFTGNTTSEDGVNSINLTASAATPDRHEIITAASTPRKDPYGGFPVFCPYGGNYSVKLGNSNPNSEAEGLSYTFTVPSTVDTFTFTYFYAVVFEDPDHPLPDQPRFFVTAYDVETKQVINCASFDYVANGTLPGFKKSKMNPGVLYKEWSPTSLQFAGMSGREVRLEFKTADCTQGAHFGYAYVDVGSGCSNILATAPYCIETNSLILNAPYGFKKYTWYNEDFSKVVGHEQSMTFSPPPATKGTFYVDVEPYPGYGCRDTLQAAVKPMPLPTVAGVQDTFFCQNSYGPSLEAVASPGNDLVWYVGDTLQEGSEDVPYPPTDAVTMLRYYVAQKTLFGCQGFKQAINVAILPMPVSNLSCSKVRQCEKGNLFVFNNKASNKSKSTFYWDFGDGETLTTDRDTSVSHSYNKGGVYNVQLKVSNAGACDDISTLQVVVIPKPVADFGYPSPVCQSQTKLSLIDQSYVEGGVAPLQQWWWSIAGKEERRQVPNSFIPSTAGDIVVLLATKTSEGCMSDTLRRVLNVHPQPTASFSVSGLMCNNEVLRFRDASYLPTGIAGEALTRWDWEFVGKTSSAQHPAINLNPGTQQVKLTVESSFGCRSPQTDSFVQVFEKPYIGLYITDSCVNRRINYEAKDLSGTVQDWHWDFGANWRKDDSVITRSYSKEGTRPLYVMGTTVDGCKDTIYRPFAIYANHAKAGKDTVAAMTQPVQLDAGGGTNNTYTWSPSTGLSNPAIEAPVALLDHDQVYHLYAITREGCDSRSHILIKRYKGPTLYVPTAFTPNGDGLNDVLKVFPVGTGSLQYMSVYNRSGQLMFTTTDKHKGWDGTYNGVMQASGNFIVVVAAKDYRGYEMLQKQSVMLIR